MAYSKELLDHYENPKNVGSLDKASEDVGYWFSWSSCMW